MRVVNLGEGKGWARGYYGYRPHTFRNMGTNNGRHPFDLRVFLRNFMFVYIDRPPHSHIRVLKYKNRRG